MLTPSTGLRFVQSLKVRGIRDTLDTCTSIYIVNNHWERKQGVEEMDEVCLCSAYKASNGSRGFRRVDSLYDNICDNDQYTFKWRKMSVSVRISDIFIFPRSFQSRFVERGSHCIVEILNCYSKFSNIHQAGTSFIVVLGQPIDPLHNETSLRYFPLSNRNPVGTEKVVIMYTLRGIWEAVLLSTGNRVEVKKV
ncbi:hypothetical protein LOAG_03954 [Loa loa]|uniref:Uncharacterized protein n=1 Tax=Loa loa TaxID=7209 RepID=A0A1S0U390_LOALO|nr:hypothetical protein LOAG_03954 [Loa loa]EFO24533.2 hypothetical protein LOAG_03954 [Loa loa]